MPQFSEIYQVGQSLGEGAFGYVMSAVHRRTGIQVAIKIAKPGQEASYRREVRMFAALDHPRIARVLDLGTLGSGGLDGTGRCAGLRWLALPIASGGTMNESDPTSWTEVRAWLLDVLEGLAHAHARGVVHRDIKPENLIFGTNSDLQPGLLIVDFGIAWCLHSAGLRGGTPGFMAPEQNRVDGRISHWTDVYALGMVAWWLVTGSLPFEDPDPAIHLRRQHSEDLPELSPVFPCPAGLRNWIARCTAREIGERISSAGDAAVALMELDGKASDWNTLIADNGGPAPFDSPDLYGLLSPSPVERGPVQRKLWAAVESIWQSRRPRGVRVCGPPGSGRRSLLMWLCERAYVEKRAHFVGLTRLETLPIWARNFVGDTPPEMMQHVERFETATEPLARQVHAARYLQTLALQRPVVVYLEEDQPVHALLQLLEDVDAPIAVVSALSRPATGPWTLVSVPALSTQSLRRVLQGRIACDPVWVERAIEQADGLPGRAVEHLGQLLCRGELTGEDPQRLMEALDHATRRSTSLGRRAMECAAVLGEKVSIEAWEQAFDTSPERLRARVEAEDLLIREGLATGTTTLFTFAAGVRTVLLGMAAVKGRLGLHRKNLIARLQPGPLRARMRLDAGDRIAAVDELVSCLPDHADQRGPHSALVILDEFEQATRSHDPRLSCARVRYLAKSSRIDEARKLGQRLLKELRPTSVRLEVRRWVVFCLRRSGAPLNEDLRRLIREAQRGSGDEAITALEFAYRILLGNNELDRAFQVLLDARQRAKTDCRPYLRALLDLHRARAVRDTDALLDACAAMTAATREAPRRRRMAQMYQVEALHEQGHLQRAREILQRMLETDETHHPTYNVAFDLLTLAAIEVTAGNLDIARRLVSRSLHRSNNHQLHAACEHIEIVLDIRSDPKRAEALAARFLSRTDLPDPAEVRLLHQAAEASPDSHIVAAANHYQALSDAFVEVARRCLRTPRAGESSI